ncbi:MAG TPA: amidohydrolase family protein [Candidatus Eremiobacteraceae bacterium]
MSAKRTIVNVRAMLDGTGSAARTGVAIVIENGRIAAIERAHKSRAATDETHVIDGGALTAVPGLINMHAHLDSMCGPDFAIAARLATEAASALAAAHNAWRTVRSGVTTVRDLGNPFGVAIALRDAIERGHLRGPRVLAAGKIVCMTGGHCWYIGLESDGPHEMRKAVRENLKAGADCIKVIATGGVLSPGVEVGHAQLDIDELSVAVNEAHRAGRRVAAHAIGAAGVKNALRAGVDTIEHGCYLDAESIALFQSGGATYVPTLSAPYWLRKHVDELPAYAARKTNEVYDAHRESFAAALKAGVRIAAGTDAGTPFNNHDMFAHELVLMTELGMSPEDALLSATSRAATALGLDGECGTLAPGLSADIALVDGDPRTDVSALGRIRMVFARGRCISPANHDA